MDKLIAILSAIKESYRISLEISLDVGGMNRRLGYRWLQKRSACLKLLRSKGYSPKKYKIFPTDFHDCKISNSPA